MKRVARKYSIKNYLRISLAEVRSRFVVCKDKCNYFRKNEQQYRTRHLKNRLTVAKSKGGKEVDSRILVIISEGKQRAY